MCFFIFIWLYISFYIIWWWFYIFLYYLYFFVTPTLAEDFHFDSFLDGWLNQRLDWAWSHNVRPQNFQTPLPRHPKSSKHLVRIGVKGTPKSRRWLRFNIPILNRYLDVIGFDPLQSKWVNQSEDLILVYMSFWKELANRSVVITDNPRLPICIKGILYIGTNPLNYPYQQGPDVRSFERGSG